MDKGGLRTKGDKVVRRSPIKRGKKCGRPFVPPRQVRQSIINTIAETVQETTRLDTTASTPEIFQSLVTDTVEAVIDNVAIETVQAIVPVTEQQDEGSDSDDNIPVVTLIRKEKGTTLSLQQINDCKEGPKGEKAIGVGVAKVFEGVEFRGIIDRFRTVRHRLYYHVTYSDGDEEEMSQAELRDAYVLGLADEIKAQWETMIQGQKNNAIEDTNISEVETSDGEGSEYDRADYNEDLKNKKRTRKENGKSCTKKKKTNLSGCVLPLAGEKTVAAEAYEKLSESEKRLVVDKVNRKTKKVMTITVFGHLYFFFTLRLNTRI
jgi:hypothetical protein